MIRARENGEALGLRSVDALDRLARVHGWELAQKHSVPLGNWVLDFARAEGSDETVRG